MAENATFRVSSPDFEPGGTVKSAQVFDGWGCTGRNVSPELSWSGAPAGTRSYAVTIYDPDAPTGSGWWHWLIFNIPAGVTGLAAGAGDPAKGVAPAGTVQSRTDYGTLGYGLPAAFGAKLGAPSRPAVCLIGDGGLQFSLQELASAVEAKIAAAVVVWNNSSYGEIKAFMAEKGIPQIGVDIFTPDLTALAAAMGCAVSAPTTIAELETELRASASRHVPTLIEIREGSTLAQLLAE